MPLLLALLAMPLGVRLVMVSCTVKASSLPVLGWSTENGGKSVQKTKQNKTKQNNDKIKLNSMNKIIEKNY
jgi:hypothetical protein